MYMKLFNINFRNCRNFRLLFLLLINLFIYSSYCLAGNHTGAVSLSLGAGYDFFSSKRHIDNTGFPFIALGYQFTPRWGIEAMAGKFRTTSHHPVDDGERVNGAFLLIDGIYHLTATHLIEPFLLAGVGINSFNPNGTNANNEGNVNVGAGVQIFFDPTVALRFEARDVRSNLGGKNDILVNGGVTFLFDWC
jgi:hypothetical protein